MHRKALIIALMSVCMGTGSAAFAQSRDYRGEVDQRSEHNERHDGYERGDRHDRYNRHERDRYDDRRGDRYDSPRGGYQPYDHHQSGRQHFRRGAYLDHQYRSSSYVVSDWRSRRLSAPPRGSHWVQANGDYLLVAVGTGLITQVLLNQ
ncbi:RcnB family protein [Massilia antarctica]|uniref:RcnB family protein n=1 Tax=Massilia antarctica TaxID=2765360 RepID=UPI0006BDAD38|nr:RcnB family protein [Massilia sp. H27-R4]MCY0911503.1 RcnB family protein [Massilia sp. H27-R4]CUI04890.1 Probable transmembrane protein [Janthinobacterium sp. CG23_2]CUU28676.1 Probable transmembrane protein [Janthinobacterium sp. CG23_2]